MKKDKTFQAQEAFSDSYERLISTLLARHVPGIVEGDVRILSLDDRKDRAQDLAILDKNAKVDFGALGVHPASALDLVGKAGLTVGFHNRRANQADNFYETLFTLRAGRRAGRPLDEWEKWNLDSGYEMYKVLFGRSLDLLFYGLEEDSTLNTLMSYRIVDMHKVYPVIDAAIKNGILATDSKLGRFFPASDNWFWAVYRDAVPQSVIIAEEKKVGPLFPGLSAPLVPRPSRARRNIKKRKAKEAPCYFLI